MVPYESTLVISPGKSRALYKNNYLKLLCVDTNPQLTKPYRTLRLCSNAPLPWSQECHYHAIYHGSG